MFEQQAAAAGATNARSSKRKLTKEELADISRANGAKSRGATDRTCGYLRVCNRRVATCRAASPPAGRSFPHFGRRIRYGALAGAAPPGC